jgi:lipoate-protein ligase A
VDKDKLGRYLSPPKAKLEAKGVASVRSRVVNLKELSPALTIEGMRANMIRAFEDVYGLSAERFIVDADMQNQIAALKELYSSWDYLYGAPLSFTFSCEEKFDWGYIQLQLDAKGGTILDVQLNTDAMDWTLPDSIVKALKGCRFDTESMVYALQQAFLPADVCEDLCSLIRKQSL